MKRILCAITIGYLLIIMGLYKIGIVPFYHVEKSNIAIIQNFNKATEYKKIYTAKIKGKNYLIYVDKKLKNLKIGDKIEFLGEYDAGEKSRNFGGFNYNIYLRSKNLYGTYKIENFKILGKNKSLIYKIKILISGLRKNVINLYNSNLNKSNAAILNGLIVGNKNDIDKDTIKNFRKASLSHVLAISGAHFSYIVLVLNFINKILKHKKIGYYVNILIMIFFIFFTGATPSVVRAGVMNILLILAKLLHKKSDFWTNLAVSLLIQVIINPFVIFDVGLVLSYTGVIGIVTLYNNFIKIIKNKIISVTLSANLALLPIMISNFNMLSLSFIISNLVATVILGPIIICGFLSIIFRFKFLFLILNFLISLLNKSAKICASIPFSVIYICTPSMISVLAYYLLYCKKYIKVLIIIVVVSNLNFQVINANIKDELLINFVDVSQGDCTLIRYQNKNILIDGGGSLDKNQNIGETTLVPYLMDRKVGCIDYLIFSHFDNDHCQGLIYVAENLKVKNIVIGVQVENYSNYIKLKEIAITRNIKIITLKQGNSIKYKNLKLFTAWPNSDHLITDNAINNNSLVLKLTFKSFSILFTGDIESIAENEILREKINVKCNILKVAHHGSDTSSIIEFLEKANPQYALIGVGKNNKFKHPSISTINKLKNKKIKIYRTDEMGEITIVTDGKKININSFIKSAYK